MTDAKQMEIDQSQAQAQQQTQQQTQQTQQMIITPIEMQQNVQQQQQNANQQNQQQQQNQQMSNGPQKLQAQVQVQPQVAAIMPQQHDTVSVSMQPQQQQSQVGAMTSMTLSGQQGASTITTMAAHPQVQVIQQPVQNQYLPQLYNAQGTPILMPGNLIHPANINPSSIQVPFNNITGKPLQPGQFAPQIMAAAPAPSQGGAHAGAQGAKVQGYPASYITVPTSATPGGGQTFVLGPLEVLPQQSAAMQQQQQQQGNNKSDQVQKYATCTTGAPSGQRAGGMQFTPWQFATQAIWTPGLQPQTLITPNHQIYIREDPTQPGMYIQSPQPIQTHNAIAAQQQIQSVPQIATSGGKPRVVNIQQQPSNKQGVVGQRPLSILPSSLQGIQAANIRPASSVSTQTNHSVQTAVHTQGGKATGGAGKGRGKPVVRTSPGPNAISVSVAKSVTGANQLKANVQQTMIMHPQPASSNGNKIILTNPPINVTSVQTPGSPMTVDKQNFVGQGKQLMQAPQQQAPQVLQPQPPQQQMQQQQNQQQQSAQQQQQAQAPQQPQPQPQHHQLHQIFVPHFSQHQQQQLQQQYQQAQAGPQQIQPKPIMSNFGMTVQPGQPPQNMQLISGDRPIMPVVSINPALIGSQIVSGTHSLQALPTIVNQSPPEQIQATQQMQAASQMPPPAEAPTMPLPSMPMIVTSPDRPHPMECTILPPPPASTPMIICNEDPSKLITPVKKDSATTKSEEVPPSNNAENANNTNNSMETEQKSASKDEGENTGMKTDDKTNNPLVNLANAVNSIPNGNIADDSSMLDPNTLSINKQVPPKAMVKPQVLTHVIEGFVIQEASEPFAVNRPTMNGLITQEINNGKMNSIADKENLEDPPSKKKKLSNKYTDDGVGYLGKCEACGNALDEQNMKLKKDKRFCSASCAKSKKKEIKEMGDKQWIDMEVDKNKNGDEKSLLPLSNDSPADDSTPKINPVKWTVGEVYDFIRKLPGCADYADDFAIQEIDGQALMLLKEDHLMSAMNMKLGPALKIVARIDSMRLDSMTNTSPVSAGNA